MAVKYTQLPNPSSALDAEREMADTFDLDDDDKEGDNDTSLRITVPSPQTPSRAESSPGIYDFEREYDFPPPGSPPRPTSRALPNDFGNSNGFLPTAPVAVPKPRVSLFRRAIGTLLPTHYTRIPTTENRPTGGGIENDGVFANVTAKPQPARVVRTEDGDVHVVPEDTQKEGPPSYLEAQADAVPPYWETTVHAPGLEPGADMIIDDLPTGSFLIFCLNVFISFFFQFVGFLLTYLLHTSHAAKFGSRAGLGLTLIQYGFYSRTMSFGDDNQSAEGSSGGGVDQHWGTTDTSSATPVNQTENMMSPTSRDWLSFLFMTLGWFLLLSSIIGFWRVKRWEHSIRNPPLPPSPEQHERDNRVRQTLEEVLGIPFPPPESDQQALSDRIHREIRPTILTLPANEARLARDLRAAGLI